jgi:membrane protease YdiL (CAAX protease family)
MRTTTPLESKSWAYGSSGNLRAVWRIGAFICVWYLANGVVSATAEPVLSFLSQRAGGVIGSAEWISALAALATVAVVLRQIDGKPWAAVGLARDDAALSKFARGVELGGAAILLTVVLLFAFGNLHFVADTTSTFLTGDASKSPLGAWLTSTARISLLLAPAAFFEELVFRGYLWRVAEDSTNTATALVVTSILFGAVHLQNPGANVLAIVNVMLAGVGLGLVRMLTGSLWAAWSAHFVWNWIMAAALHVSVSGLPMATPGYRATFSGAEWISGGAWGPEGGAVATVVLVAAIAWGAQHSSFTHILPNFMRRRNNAVAARG